jgi:chromosome segregation ATPase
MRLTPQPEGDSGSIVCNEHEITHVSDSMSGTAEGEARLRRQLAGVEEALEHERSHGRAAAEEFHEKETDWDKRQTKFEDLEREYRLLLGRMKVTEEQLETANKNKETLQERLTARTLELREVNEQLEAQRKTDSLSEDEKIKEITRLRSELAAAQEEAKRAVNNKQSVESTFEYQKEQFRIAQDAASAAQSSVDELSKENAKLQHQASGEPARLKALHLDRLYEQQARQIKRLKAETTVLKHTVKQKDEELARVKNTGRTGYGTRAQSATPQPPKIRSRAGSPMGGRLSNLRKE